MKCAGCGAENMAAAVVCEFCGSALETSADNGQQAALARVKASAVYAARNSPQRLAQLPRHSAVHKAAIYGFFVVFIGSALFVFVMALGITGVFGLVAGSGARGPGAAFSLVALCMGVVPLLLVALGVWAFWHTAHKMQTRERAPVDALAAIVLDKRMYISGGGDGSRASTEYYVTCATEDGQRCEYQVWDGALYGKLAAGDAGVVFLRAACALDFDRA